MNKDLIAIFEYLEREKGIKRDVVIQAIEDSLKIAAKKSINNVGNVTISIHPKSGDIEVIAEKEIVEKVEYPDEEISLDAARKIDPDCEVGQWIEVIVTPSDFGRIAAQVARQVISQKLKGAERDVIYEEYRHRVSEIISGTVKRLVKGASLIVDLGKVEAILPERFYPKSEKYNPGDKVTALLLEVRDTENGGAEVVLSRSHPQFVEALFAQEIPEVNDGTIKIRKIVRDAGYRTKMAVSSKDLKLDPVGACVGVRGSRIKNIIRELNNEKIDVLPYSDDPITLLKNAVSPVELKKIEYDAEEQLIAVVVSDEDYPVVLGKKGTNARLIGDLLNVVFKVYKNSEYEKEVSMEQQQMIHHDDPSLDSELKIEGVNSFVIDSLIASGFDTPRKLLTATPQQIAKLTNLSHEMILQILEQLRKQRKSVG
jgi:N utilization substance protein A